MANLDFYPGAQVVCIDDNWVCRVADGIDYPTLGGIYTIDEIYDFWSDGQISFTLKEINPLQSADYFIKPSWYSWHFAPVKHYDISVFTEILKKLPNKILEDA